MEEENEALRQQLVRVQEQLQAFQAPASPDASPQVAPALPAKPPPLLLHCLRYMKVLQVSMKVAFKTMTPSF